MSASPEKNIRVLRDQIRTGYRRSQTQIAVENQMPTSDGSEENTFGR